MIDWPSITYLMPTTAGIELSLREILEAMIPNNMNILPRVSRKKAMDFYVDNYTLTTRSGR